MPVVLRIGGLCCVVVKVSVVVAVKGGEVEGCFIGWNLGLKLWGFLLLFLLFLLFFVFLFG